nr:hypothetical protein [Amycolatopsis balhimycina]
MLAPPTVDPAGGVLLWSNLVGLLRPSRRRRFTGQPHLGWEYRFSEHGVSLRRWVPGTIPAAAQREQVCPSRGRLLSLESQQQPCVLFAVEFGNAHIDWPRSPWRPPPSRRSTRKSRRGSRP